MSRVEIIVGDITTVCVDAIVNAANDRLLPGGGVCGSIFDAAGEALEAECKEIGGCSAGDAVMTGPGRIATTKKIIHAVGPRWRGGSHGEVDLLASCYRRSLELARDAGLTSIAFPCISTGIYGYPPDRAAAIALRVCAEWRGEPERIVCCCFCERDAEVYRGLQRGSGIA